MNNTNKFLQYRPSQPVNKYLLSCIPSHAEILDGWNVTTTTDADRVKFAYDTFISEYGWAIDRMGLIPAMAEWLAGLPSALNVDFYYSDILRIGKDIGMLTVTGYKPLDAHNEEKLCQNWFKDIAYKFLHLHAYVVKATK